jgi:hypothetical protein
MDIVDRIDKFLTDTTVAADVATNTAKGKIDVIGGECPKGTVYDKIKKVCVPINNEGYVYVYNSKKNKRIRISDDPEIIEKYKKKGFVVEASVVGATYVSGNSNIAGSGQTRIWGERFGWMVDLNRKEPVNIEMDDKAQQNIIGRLGLKFSEFLGAYVPKGETG